MKIADLVEVKGHLNVVIVMEEELTLVVSAVDIVRYLVVIVKTDIQKVMKNIIMLKKELLSCMVQMLKNMLVKL